MISKWEIPCRYMKYIVNTAKQIDQCSIFMHYDDNFFSRFFFDFFCPTEIQLDAFLYPEGHFNGMVRKIIINILYSFVGWKHDENAKKAQQLSTRLIELLNIFIVSSKYIKRVVFILCIMFDAKEIESFVSKQLPILDWDEYRIHMHFTWYWFACVMCDAFDYLNKLLQNNLQTVQNDFR